MTGRPHVVDVVARPQAVPLAREWSLPTHGWEVQLSPQDGGTILERQEFRAKWLRCNWVTRRRPAWADRVPWYQVAQVPGSARDAVVDGVYRWVQLGSGGGGDYFPLEPFEAGLMVHYILRGAIWTSETGWSLEKMAVRRTGQRRRRLEPTASVVAEFCNRVAADPDVARGWTEAEWLRYARVAHYRLAEGMSLSELDRAALARVPSLDLADPEEGPLLLPPYDPLSDTRPCVHCGQLVAVSVSPDYPLHHHCAWHIGRRSECRYATADPHR